jgi:hypothetical protein
MIVAEVVAMTSVVALVSSFGVAIVAVVGVVIGARIPVRAQGDQWLRNQQIAAYQTLLRTYADFMMRLRRAHLDHAHWDFDWGSWSGGLVAVSIVAPPKVAEALAAWSDAINALLKAQSVRWPERDPLTEDELELLILPVAQEQVRFVNAIRHSLGINDDLVLPMGGAPRKK